ncbi:unnamed protein product, partial [marine sediment metagenome]
MSTPNQATRRAFLGRALRLGGSGLIGPHLARSALASAESWKDGPWQIGCYTRPWHKYDYRVALDAIAEAGFKYAGLMTAKSKTGLVISAATPPDEARRIGLEANKRGLKIPSVYGGDFPVHVSLEAGIAGL